MAQVKNTCAINSLKMGTEVTSALGFLYKIGF